MKMMVLECTVMNMESSIKGLLERWSQLEPQLCRKDWLDDYRIEINETYRVVVDADKEIKQSALAGIQWAVQQAIIEKGWYFKLNNFLNDKGYAAKVISDINKEEVSLTISNNPIEALLAAYLKVLEASKVTD